MKGRSQTAAAAIAAPMLSTAAGIGRTGTTTGHTDSFWSRISSLVGRGRLRSKRYPSMVTSSDAEIAEHNKNVNTRQVRRRRESGRGVRP